MANPAASDAAPHPSCLTCEGRARNEWCTLGAPELARLDQARTHATFAPGDVVFRQGQACEGVHCVEAGLVGLRKCDAQGNALLVGLAHANDTLGHAALFSGGRHSETAVALTGSRVCTIPRATVESLVVSNPALAQRFLRRLAREVRAAGQERLDALVLPVRARLAQLLLALADRYGRAAASGGLEVVLPLARQDMAALLGVRPESIARAVRALSDAGTARFEGRLISIPSIDGLMAELPPTD